MALVHVASITPSKAELLASWLPSRPWGPTDTEGLEIVGSYRLDDPEGEVGVEVHLVAVGGTTYQVPFTYRGAPLADAAEALVGTMEHTVLGSRWVYDGLADPVCLRLLASATATGVGQTANQALDEGRWVAMSPTARLSGHGLLTGRVEIDGLTGATTEGTWTALRNEHLELRFAHLPEVAEESPTGAVLTATWKRQDSPAVLAVVTRLGD